MTRRDAAQKAANRFKSRTKYNVSLSRQNYAENIIEGIDRAVFARYLPSSCSDLHITRLFERILYAWNTGPKSEVSGLNFHIREYILAGCAVADTYHAAKGTHFAGQWKDTGWRDMGEKFINDLDDAQHGIQDFGFAFLSLKSLIIQDQVWEKSKKVMNDIPDLTCVGNFWLALVAEGIRHCDEHRFAVYPPEAELSMESIEYFFT